MTQDRIGYLDALRGGAALWVVLVHVALIPGPALQVPAWARLIVLNGAMGVELFFVVSALSLCIAMVGHQREARPLVGFALRRFFRIAPLFYALIVVMLLWNPWHQALGLKEVFLNVTFLFNFFPGPTQWSFVPAGWTIGVEVPFYLIFPIVFKYCKGLAPSIAFFLLTICLGEFSKMISDYLFPGNDYMLRSVLTKFPIFAAGLVVYYAMPFLLRLQDQKSWGYVSLSSALALFIVITTNNLPPDNYYWRGIIFALVVVGFALNPIKLAVNDATKYLGRISYSLYLLHIPVILLEQPVFHLMERSGLSDTISFSISALLVIATTILLATIVHHVFERPANDFGRRIANQLAGRSMATPAGDVATNLAK